MRHSCLDAVGTLVKFAIINLVTVTYIVETHTWNQAQVTGEFDAVVDTKRQDFRVIDFI